MKLSYKRDMAHNYMIPECGQETDENDYRIHMLTENRIQGLLPCTVKKRDGNNCFYYDITSKQSLEHIYGRGNMGETEILSLLRGLHRTLREIKKYLLDASMIILDPQMIYMDIESKEPSFCYLPGYRKDITRSFQELSAYILEHICQTDERAVLLGYDIYRKAREENYSLEKILKISGEEKKFCGETVLTPVSVKEQDWERLSSKIEIPQEAYRMPEDSEKNIKQAGKTEGKPQKKERKDGGWTFFIVCGAFAVILFGAAAVLWGLDTTQIGGIIFFLTAVLAYGCILDRKKKKKKTDNKEQKMPYMIKEQPYIHEEVREKKKEKEREPKRQEQHFGNTAVLAQQEEADTLMLVSMSIDRQEPVLLTKEQYIIGKLKSQADIVLDHNSISRIHAKIRREQGEYYLYDLNSTNGTFHNGRRLEVNERIALRPGDEISFARTGFYVAAHA